MAAHARSAPPRAVAGGQGFWLGADLPDGRRKRRSDGNRAIGKDNRCGRNGFGIVSPVELARLVPALLLRQATEVKPGVEMDWGVATPSATVGSVTDMSETVILPNEVRFLWLNPSSVTGIGVARLPSTRNYGVRIAALLAPPFDGARSLPPDIRVDGCLHA